MNEYQIGRDLQDLRSRIDRIEAGVHGNHEMDDRYGLGHASASTLMGAVSGKPIAWEQPKAYPLPAFVTGFLNVEPALLQTLADVQTAGPQPNSMGIHLRDGAGGSLFHWAHNYWVGCRDNHVVVFEKDFPAGLYDIVRGATWEHVGVRINRC